MSTASLYGSQSLALAWVLTLPAAITLSASLFALFVYLF